MTKDILIVIDMQNDFITGSLANPAAEAIVSPICNVISLWHGPIICTRDTHDTDYLKTTEGKALPIEHCIKDTAGWCIEDHIQRALRGKNPLYINKNTFGYNNWDDIYDDVFWNVRNIYLCGTCTDICVISNAILLKTLYPDHNIVVCPDLCAGSTKDKHEAAIKTMESCQIQLGNPIESAWYDNACIDAV